MHYEYFDCDVRDGIARVALLGSSAPPLREFCDEFVDLLLRLQEDRAARVILLSDAGGSLDPVLDLHALAEERSQGEGAETLVATLDVVRRVVTLLQEMAKPIVAAVGGEVRDGGLGLLLACDVRLACTTASFAVGNMSSGLLPDWGLTATLTRAVGHNRALDLLWSGRTVGAVEAERIGLVDRVIDADVYEDAVEAFAAKLCDIPQPALLLSKLAVQQAGQFDLTTMLSLEIESQQQCWDSRETTAGLAALISGEDPGFSSAYDAEDE
jgi:enoyl-CoA hydratase/carnithine racemase